MKLHPVSLGAREKLECDVALSIYADQLTKKAKEAENLGKQGVADAWKAEAKAINAVAGETGDQPPGLRARIRQRGTPELATNELPIVRNALAMFAKRLKAASSTVRALGEDDKADDLKEKAGLVSERTLAIFNEQVQMHFDIDSPERAHERPPAPPKPAEPADPQQGDLLPDDMATALCDTLWRVGYDVPPDTVRGWTEEQRADVHEWAHAVANDADIVPPVPSVLDGFERGDEGDDDEITRNEAEAAAKIEKLGQAPAKKGSKKPAKKKGRGRRGGRGRSGNK